MSKRKGLGRDVNKSIEVMESLQANLKEFLNMPLKRGLHSAGFTEDGDGVNKSIHDAMMKAFELNHLVADLNESVKGIKVENKSSRFAAQRVISSFLDPDIS